MKKIDIILALISALLIGVLAIMDWLPLANALGLVGVACTGWFFRKEALNRWIKTGLFLLLVPLVFWVATYRPEGFSYPLVLSLPGAEGQGERFNLYINFAKALVGFCLLFLLWKKVTDSEFVARPRWQFLIALLAPFIIVALAVPVMDLALQPKAMSQIATFALVNLFAIALAEETFMRLLIQQSMRNTLANLGANRLLQELLPLALVTIIFVVIHTGLSAAALWIYALAGFLYGLSYTLSKNVFYPIMIHFWVNLLHFSWLTYPA